MLNLLKKISIFTLVCAVSLSSFSAESSPPLKNVSNTDIKTSLIKLIPFTPPQTILINGTVESIEKQTLKFEDLGKIKFIEEEGAEIKGNIVDSTGKILEQGSLLAQQYTDIEKADYEAAKAALDKAKLALKKDEDEYKRNKILVKKGAISQKSFEASKINFLKSQADLNNAQQALSKAAFKLSSDYMYSFFDAIVDEVYQFPDIWYEGFHKTISLKMVNPIAIKIPIEYISDINHLSEHPIIYSPSSNSQISDWICSFTQFEENKYNHYFIVKNGKISFYNNLPVKYAKLPKISWVCKIIYFNDKNRNLAVPLDTILTENNKQYIWKLNNNFIIDKDKSINYRIYTAEKVYVKPGEKVKINIEGSFAGLKRISNPKMKEGTLIKQNPNSLNTILNSYYKQTAGKCN